MAEIHKIGCARLAGNTSTLCTCGEGQVIHPPVATQLERIEQGLDKLMQSHAGLAKQQDTLNSMLDAVLANQMLAAERREEGFATLNALQSHQTGLGAQIAGGFDSVADEFKQTRLLVGICAAKPSKKPPRPAKKGKR